MASDRGPAGGDDAPGPTRQGPGSTVHLSGRAVPDAVMGFVARGLVRTFFRRVEVVHGARVESGRPAVLVAGHRNGLVDGLVLMAALGRYPRFLGKSTLFHNPLLWPFLTLAGVVPV
ncbi:MAG TPA: 1-acyl-sn-glycerol-3-phosphate acyltransferase, partial [Acidimicrobiales bacterium]|nr:1-acyl-sn-glycerol-3-phosphate acyltransferase [Acidimicrobiales bacterium]